MTADPTAREPGFSIASHYTDAEAVELCGIEIRRLNDALNAANEKLAERDTALEAIETLAAKGAQTELYEPLRRLWQQVGAIARGAKGETP